MQKSSTPHVDQSVHEDSVDIAVVAEARNAEVRHLGTVADRVDAVTASQRKQASAAPRPHIIHETSPRGFVRQLQSNTPPTRPSCSSPRHRQSPQPPPTPGARPDRAPQQFRSNGFLTKWVRDA